MALAIGRYLTITATMGGADAFVQGSVATDIVPEDGLILKVTGIEFAITNNQSTLGFDYQIEWSLTRDTKTAIATLSDADTVLYDAHSHQFTTSGATFLPGAYRYAPSPGLYLVEPIIYMQLDSTGTTLLLAGQMRIFYEEVRATEVEILRIINNS